MHLVRHLDQLFVDFPLLGNAVILQFKIEVSFAEDLCKLFSMRSRACIIAARDRTRYKSGKTCRKCDQAFRMCAQQIHIYTRLLVKALGKGFGDNINEVFIPLLIFAQENKMVTREIASAILVKACTLCNVYLTADDRFDSLSFACLIKCDCTV